MNNSQYFKGLTGFLHRISIVFLILFISACGSDDSSSPAVTDDNNANPKGYFFGSATVNDGTDINDMIGLAYNKRLIMFSKSGNGNVMYDIDLGIINASSYSGTAMVYVDGINPISVAVSGTTNDSNITGTFTDGDVAGSAAGYAAGTFDITYDLNDNSGASFEMIYPESWAGRIYGIDQDSGGFQTFSAAEYQGIDNTDDACIYNSVLVMPESELNIFLLNHDIKQHVVDGYSCKYLSTDHTGFAAVITTDSIDDTLVYGFSNKTIALFAVMTR